MTRITRRHLLPGLAAPFLLRRADAEVTPDIFRFRPEIEPLVTLIENTAREKCAAMAVEQLRRGVSYRQFMAALFLAGVRNVNPRPPGFAMHCVFVIHSAHLLGLEAPADARLLPLFYALDNFKGAQERDARQTGGDYVMRAIAGKLPAPDRAAVEFTAAMEAWDQERAERAVVALARHRAGGEVIDMLWRYGARDYRNIGHKAIYVANAARTLHTIGWQHAEPVLRSVVLALLDFGREQQVNGYALDDQCYNANAKRVNEIAGDVNRPEGDTVSILDVLRTASPGEACADIAARLAKGSTGAAAVWDAVHLAAAELRMRSRPANAIVSIHAVTAANALHHGWLAAPESRLRLLLLLQAAGWMAQFRHFSSARENALRDFAITRLEPGAEDSSPQEILSASLADPDPLAARVVRLARDLPARQSFFSAAVRNIVTKAEEVHLYKYLAALIEDVPLVRPEWQPHLTAAVVYYTKGSNDPEPVAIKRAREALRTL
ncbi:MAG: hypothetical protein ACRD96_01365 [Bryobacteraceae bacterium]